MARHGRVCKTLAGCLFYTALCTLMAVTAAVDPPGDGLPPGLPTSSNCAHILPSTLMQAMNNPGHAGPGGPPPPGHPASVTATGWLGLDPVWTPLHTQPQPMILLPPPQAPTQPIPPINTTAATHAALATTQQQTHFPNDSTQLQPVFTGPHGPPPTGNAAGQHLLSLLTVGAGPHASSNQPPPPPPFPGLAGMANLPGQGHAQLPSPPPPGMGYHHPLPPSFFNQPPVAYPKRPPPPGFEFQGFGGLATPNRRLQPDDGNWDTLSFSEPPCARGRGGMAPTGGLPGAGRPQYTPPPPLPPGRGVSRVMYPQVPNTPTQHRNGVAGERAGQAGGYGFGLAPGRGGPGYGTGRAGNGGAPEHFNNQSRRFNGPLFPPAPKGPPVPKQGPVLPPPGFEPQPGGPCGSGHAYNAAPLLPQAHQAPGVDGNPQNFSFPVVHHQLPTPSLVVPQPQPPLTAGNPGAASIPPPPSGQATATSATAFNASQFAASVQQTLLQIDTNGFIDMIINQISSMTGPIPLTAQQLQDGLLAQALQAVGPAFGASTEQAAAAAAGLSVGIHSVLAAFHTNSQINPPPAGSPYHGQQAAEDEPAPPAPFPYLPAAGHSQPAQHLPQAPAQQHSLAPMPPGNVMQAAGIPNAQQGAVLPWGMNMNMADVVHILETGAPLPGLNMGLGDGCGKGGL